MTEELTDLILYATPSGPLGEQIDRYLTLTQDRFGPNNAHRYPAHCTLTGFFHDVPRSIPEYVVALDQARAAAGPPPEPMVSIERMRIEGGWYGLELRSPWLIDLSAHFRRLAPKVARPDEVRLKTWLHLSLAYGFDDACAEGLASAASAIDLAADVTWDIALWQRDGSAWTRH